VRDVAALDRHRYVSLATFRRDGTTVATPVWFAAIGERLYVFTTGESGKVKRLRNSPRARVAPCDARGRLEGGWRDATARIVTDAALIQRAWTAMRAKYGWQLRLLDLFARPTGRIHRRAWIEVSDVGGPDMAPHTSQPSSRPG
jgi:PPOX class probable F420-dependent enzyme